jgi:pentatricopeptide repeat protein
LKQGRVDAALELFEEMLSSRVAPDSGDFSMLIRACIKAGRMESARQLFDEMQSRQLDPAKSIYISLIDGYGKQGLADTARELLDAMKLAGITPLDIATSIVIAAYCKTGRIDEAIDLLDAGDREGTKHDAITYNIIISACVNDGKWSQAVPIVRRAIISGAYHASAGFTGTDVLDFHLPAIIRNHAPSRRPPGVPSELAIALMEFHSTEGRISDETIYIVGQHGSGKLKNAVLAYLSIKGFRYKVSKRNPGCLIPESFLE